MVLFIGTVILAINTDFTEPVLGWRFFEGNFYLGYSIVLDVLAATDAELLARHGRWYLHDRDPRWLRRSRWSSRSS